ALRDFARARYSTNRETSIGRVGATRLDEQLDARKRLADGGERCTEVGHAVPRTTEVHERGLDIEQRECRACRRDEALRVCCSHGPVMDVHADPTRARCSDERGDLITRGHAKARPTMSGSIEDGTHSGVTARERSGHTDRDLCV